MSSFETNVPSIKVEGAAYNTTVKAETDGSLGIAGIPADEDIYEDAGDLDFSKANEQLYLTNLPTWLWEIWSQLDDKDEIEIGTMRVEGTQGKVTRVGRNGQDIH